MNKVSHFLPWISERFHIKQTLKGKCLQQEPARPVPATTDQMPYFSQASHEAWYQPAAELLSKYWIIQRKRSVVQKQKLLPITWLLPKLSHGRESPAKRVFLPQWRHARRAGGFAQHWGAWAEMDTSSHGGCKASPSLSYRSDRQGHGERAQANIFIQHWHQYNRRLGSNCWEKWKLSFHAHWILALSAGNADRALLQYPDTFAILPIGDRTKTTNPFPADNLIAIRWL